MDKKNIVKKYSTDALTVVWQASKCVHSGTCVKHLSAVFQPQTQPWIKLENATAQEIRETVAKCPSGALTVASV